MGKSAKEVLEILKKQDYLNNNDVDIINEILKLENENYNNEILSILEKLYVEQHDKNALYIMKSMSKNGYVNATKKLEEIHNKFVEKLKNNNLSVKEKEKTEKAIEEFLLFDIYKKLKDKGYTNNFNLAIDKNKDKLNFDFLKVDDITKIPLIAIELKKMSNENENVKKRCFKECIEKVKKIKEIYKNIKNFECFFVFVDNEKYEIYQIYENGKNNKKELDEILNLNLKEKKTSSFINERNDKYNQINYISTLFISNILIVYCFFSIFPDILSNYIQWILIMIGIIYGLLIFPYVKEINFWGLQIKNIDMDK